MAVATTLPKIYAHITQAAGVCGGKACIDDTRVRVNNVAYLAKTGRTPDQILSFYPQLSLGQVHAALAYYDHREEIEAELADEEDMEQLVERSRAESLKGRTSP
jgi:uncharacterized protein (DUF433 family)